MITVLIALVTLWALVKLVDMACGELAEILEGKRRLWPWSE